MRSSWKMLVGILLAIVILLFLVAVGAVVVYLLVQQSPTMTVSWQDPISQVKPDEILPDLALYPMAGALELETIDAAIANGDLETAYASLVFGSQLSDAQRIGRLILLGRRFSEAEKVDRAGLCYQQIYDLAVLSPNLSDPARADALLASGKGWAAIGATTAAQEAYDQVSTIAAHSPNLQTGQRRDLQVALAQAYQDLGAEEAAALSRQRIAELDGQADWQPAGPLIESPDLPLEGEPISSPEVGSLEETRRQAAFSLLQTFAETGSASADQVASLAGALQAEDAAKLALYRQELEATTQPSRRANVHWHTIRWLTLKYQVASRAFGLPIVPDWEAQEADIQSALSTAYENLLFDYEDLVTALPDASLVGPGSYRVRRLVTSAGRLGQYPNYREYQMAEAIGEVVSGLIAAGFVQQLYVDVRTVETGLQFFLNPGSRYGVPAQEP
jgi:hypothetical protein